VAAAKETVAAAVSFIKSNKNSLQPRAGVMCQVRKTTVYIILRWVLRENIIQRLSVFEKKILRKIFGPTKQDNGIWKIKTNRMR
jgi:hypothetical protein